jgi:hypothetical protein
VAEQIRAVINRLRDKAIGTAVASGVSLADKALYDNVAMYHKAMGNLRHFKDGVVPLAYAFIAGALNFYGWDDAITIGIYKELEGVYEAFVRKSPFCFASDASTIKCFNLDPNASVSLKIDGSSVSVSASTDANGNVTISLSSPMSAGKHEIQVATSKKAFYGFVAV